MKRKVRIGSFFFSLVFHPSFRVGAAHCSQELHPLLRLVVPWYALVVHRDVFKKNGFLYNQPSLESTEKRNKKVFFFFFCI